MSGYLYFVTVKTDKGFGWNDYNKKSIEESGNSLCGMEFTGDNSFAITQAASNNSEALQKDVYKLIPD